MDTKHVQIGQPNSPLKAVLVVEEDTRVIAVLRPNGSTMEYRDIPQWVMMEIRHRGMVYVGGAVVVPPETSTTPSPPQSTQHSNCKTAWMVAGGLFILFAIIGFLNNQVEENTTALATPTPEPLITRATPTPPTYIQPQSIISTFLENPARGKVQYTREPVHVRGEVRGFNNADSRVVYLTPARTWETDDYEVFLVRLPDLDIAASLSIGDEISMLCDISLGHAFPHGYEIECTPKGDVSISQQTTKASVPRQLAPTATSQVETTLTTFEERRQAVINQYCESNIPACVEKVGSEYCVPFYENPAQHAERLAACQITSL